MWPTSRIEAPICDDRSRPATNFLAGSVSECVTAAGGPGYARTTTLLAAGLPGARESEGLSSYGERTTLRP